LLAIVFGGSASAVIGESQASKVNLNNIAFTIVGVTPPGFEGTVRFLIANDIDRYCQGELIEISLMKPDLLPSKTRQV